MTADLPALPIVKAVLRESRFIDIEIRSDALSELDSWRLEAGDVVEFSVGLAPVDPENAVFVLHDPVRKGAILTLCVEGPKGEEGRVLSKRLLQGHCYTILRTQPKGEFTVHRHISVEGNDQLKLHFAHGGQLQKLQFREGVPVSVKEKPCGLVDFEIAECHTEDLEKCPNCRTGLKGPRQKDFNAADLCKPGTQYALVRPKERPRRGLALFAEKALLPDATLHFVMRSADKPDSQGAKLVERSRSRGRRKASPRLKSRSRERRGSAVAPRLKSRSRERRESAAGGRSRRPDQPPQASRRRTRSRSRRKEKERDRDDRGQDRAVGERQPERPRFGAVPPPNYEAGGRGASDVRDVRDARPRDTPPLRKVPAPRAPGDRSPRRESIDQGGPRGGGDRLKAESGWEELQDPDGNTYYRHAPSGRTQWEAPAELGGGKPVSEVEGVPRLEDWESAQDEEGNTFFHHIPSGRTQWEPPEGMDVSAPSDMENRGLTQQRGSSAVGDNLVEDWEACEDEQGNVFYHHIPSGDTQWEPPDSGSTIPDSDGRHDAGNMADDALDGLRKRAAGLGIRV